MKRLLFLFITMLLLQFANGQGFNKAEYFFDTDPGINNGTQIVLAGSTDTVNFTAPISIASLPAGFHFLGLRVKHNNGIWGLFENRGFYISSNTADAANITAAEYFFDADPGVGNGTALSVGTTGAVVNFTAVLPTSLAAGFHFLAIRVKGSDGIWGLYETRGFYISSSTANSANIVAAEYYYDTDPGIGNATSTTVGTTGAIVNFTAVLPTSLAAGFHFLAIRVKGSDGIWGLFETRGFYISSSTANAANIVAAEYFFDTDPGMGNATSTTVGASGAVVNFTAVLPTSLAAGFHLLALRVKGTDGVWGLFETRGFYISSITANMPIITAAEYFFDADPGIGNGISLTVTTPGNIVTQTFVVPAGALSLGQHFVSIRVKDQAGNWSLYDYDTLNIGNSTIACHTDTTLNTGIGQCASIVNGIDPNINIPQAYTYSLTGATTGTGSGTASGHSFNAGVTNVAYALSGSPTVNCTFKVTINAIAPAITTQPATQSICAGSNVTFTVIATGAGLTYQWRKGGVNIGSATSASFTITGVVIGDAGSYDVVVTSPCTLNATSAAAVLTVGTTNITSQPASQAVCPGTNVTFSVTATGSSLIYQWRKGGVNISGATGSSFTITGVVAGDAGNYDVVVTGGCGSVTSNNGILTVNPLTVITLNPLSQAVCAGTNVTFSSSATGTGVLTYQWKKNTVNISGATSSDYTINGVAAGDAANYTVVVTGNCGTATSSIAVLAVNPITVISLQPANQSSCLGGSVTFGVTATGTSLTYQWKKNAVDIGGATSASYSINPVTAGDAATYSVSVTGTCGTLTSGGATLTITAGTVINTQPSNQLSCLGGNVTFSISASGSGTVTYQWKKNGIDISGATLSSYTINPVTAGDAANYSVVAISLCGSTASNTASLTIIPASVIATQPSSQTVCLGNNATFTMSATGDNLTYQWRKAGVIIGGATLSSYTIIGVIVGDIGNYDVVVTGTCGIVTSNTVSLSLGNIVINNNPVSQTVCTGTNVTFSVGATGSGITYQWRKGGVNIGGATGSSFTITGVVTGDAGTYDVFVNGTCGAVTSNIATLLVNTPPAITSQPISQAICVGNNITFSVIANGTGLTYQWRKGGVNIGAATSSSFTITGVVIGDAGNYDVVVSGACAPNVISNPVTLIINTPPAITSQPANQTSCLGGNVTFSVSTTGTGLTYQWRKGGVNIGAATGSSYTITGIVAGDAGSYDVVISGTCPPVLTSAAATLIVNTAPAISLQPISQTVCVGTNVTFSVTATGTGVTYQWRKGGINIGGANSNSYTITGVVIGSAGNYDVIVSGTCTPSVTSNTAVLTINTAPAITSQPVGQSVCTGVNVSFSVTVTGSGLIYQWRKGGINISGANSNIYTVTGVTPGDAGNYDVVISGSCSPAVTSNIAALIINIAPSITSQPVSQSVCPGTNVTFSVTSTGTGLTYQWRKAGVNISGATGINYTINGVAAGDAGNYDVIVTSPCGIVVTSGIAILTINITTVITTQPVSQSGCIGSSVTYSIVASGSLTLFTYQWQVSTNGGSTYTNLTGSTSASLTLTNISVSQNNNLYRCIASGSCGTINSSAATLTVNTQSLVTISSLPAKICLSDTLIALQALPLGGVWSGTGVVGNNFLPYLTTIGSFTLKYVATNSFGCKDSASIVAKVELCPERFLNLNNGGLGIYPNPNNGRFNIKLKSSIFNYLVMRVYSSQGAIIRDQTFSGLQFGRVIQVDLSNLAAGVYPIKFFSQYGVLHSEMTIKLIIAGH